MKKFFIALLVVILTVSFVGCTISDTDPNKNDPSKTSYSLNETAELKDLKVTATEIRESTGESFFTPESGNVFVGVKFTIENISNEDQAVSSLMQFQVYADDVKCDYSISALSAFSDGTLDGTIGAGKKLIGWYAVEVSENWKTIEVDFQADILSSKTTKFVFADSDCANSGGNSNSNTNSGANSGSNNNTSNPPADTAYGLNETATLNTLKITATEVKESKGESIFTPENGNVFVGVKFTVENISNEEQTISTIMQFEAYADDVKCSYSFNAVCAFSDGTLDGTVAAGKKLVGWYAIEVPENWKTIELVFQEDLLSNTTVEFAFSK